MTQFQDMTFVSALEWALTSEENAATIREVSVDPGRLTARIVMIDGMVYDFTGEKSTHTAITTTRSISGLVLQRLAAELLRQ